MHACMQMSRGMRFGSAAAAAGKSITSVRIIWFENLTSFLVCFCGFWICCCDHPRRQLVSEPF
jgi:hypothetical protein